MKIATIPAVLIVTILALHSAEKKPVTNADVVKMLKADLPESTILLAIQNSPRDFDLSVDGLVELKTNGVPPKIIDAMLQTPATIVPVSSPTTASSLVPQAIPGGGALDAKGRPSTAVRIEEADPIQLQSSPFKIIETKAKGKDVATLMTESAITDVASNVVGAAAYNITTGGVLGNFLPGAHLLTNAIGKKIFKPDEVVMTYVCALAGQTASYSIERGKKAEFVVHFSDIPGVDPEEFQPVLVKANPTSKNWRLISAIKAKKSEFTDLTQPIDFSIIEECVPTIARKVARGQVALASTDSLTDGQYAIVLRPLSPTKKILLHEIEAYQGEGGALREVWDFSVITSPASASETREKK